MPRLTTPGALPALAADAPETILLIEAALALPLIDRLPRRASVVVARFSGLDKALLRRVQPDRVIVPLIAPGFDALDALARLHRLRYAGHVCAVTPPLPDAAMVEAELRQRAGALAFDLVELR